MSFWDIIQLLASFFTYISQSSSATTSWLDHIACSNPQLVSQIKILYGDALEDHIPIYCEVAIPCINSETNLQDQHSEKFHIKWDNISDDQKTLYSDNLDELAIEIWADVLSCNLSICYDPSHQRQLDYVYSALVESLHVAAFPLNVKSKNSRRQIPGWNWYCRDLHADGRKHFLNWCRNGRPRNNELFEVMKTSRAAFKNALKFCRRNELRIKKAILLSKFEQKKTKEFWKEVRKIKGNTTVSRCIDGTSILQDTVKIFDRKYKEVLDNSECQAHSVATDPMLRGSSFSFTPKDLDDAIDRLNQGLGFDGVHTEQIKNAKRCYRNLLCKFYNKLISHTYIPHSMLKGHIRPTVKNSSGKKKLIRKTTGL